jgi:hypothetical protein
MNNKILFKKMPYNVRKEVTVKYAVNEKFEDVQIAGVKSVNEKDILGKKLKEDVVIIGEIIPTTNEILYELCENFEVGTIRESLDDLLMRNFDLKLQLGDLAVMLRNPNNLLN